jgi:hypothetical protein
MIGKGGTYHSVNAMNKLAGPPASRPLPIWTYRAVPMVPPMPGQNNQHQVIATGVWWGIPISWMWRDLSVRWVLSPGETLRTEALSGEVLLWIPFSFVSLRDAERRLPSMSTAVDAIV